jgi:hypothetical protein
MLEALRLLSPKSYRVRGDLIQADKDYKWQDTR